jgi:hypothetical protein
MEGIGCLVVIGLGALLLVAVLVNNERIRREHEAIVSVALKKPEDDQDHEASEETARWLAIEKYFPYVPKPKPASTSAEDIRTATWQTLETFHVCAVFWKPGWPVPMPPPEERRKHLCILGKTGSGKSTFLEHLIVEDLEAGRGVGVIGPEGELFQRLLALVPRTRTADVVYFAPGHPECPLTFNPLALEEGDDAARAAEDLFTIFRRALGDDELGPRMTPILQNGLAALVGRPGTTLFDLKRLLEDGAFRYQIASTTPDPYVREFWLETYPRYPKGADLPIVNRLDQFLRPAAVRRALCNSESSFSVRESLAEGRILFLDLFGLPEEPRLLMGQLLLAKFQLELMRREIARITPAPYHLYCDELSAVAGQTEGTWRELLSRGRKYGVSVTVATQHPGQLPTGLQAEIFGNVNSLVSFALGAKDAQALRKEFTIASFDKNNQVRWDPLDATELSDLETGVAWAKLGGGKAVRIAVLDPKEVKNRWRGAEVTKTSWRRYRPKKAPPAEVRIAPVVVREPESFLE